MFRWALGILVPTRKKYPVILAETDRDRLHRLIAAGTAPARKLTHARILLKADQGPDGPGWVDMVVFTEGGSETKPR